jgi:mannose-1-phosphate guanylyltransferase
MVRATLDRLAGLDVGSPLVVANAAHAALVANELTAAGHDPKRIILEPFGRNTAPAAAVAALELTRSGDDPLMLLLPADHVILDVPAFQEAVLDGCRFAAAGNLVTFGIVPTNPETGYGYIHAGEPLDGTAHRVDRFVEKPNLETAQSYMDIGGYLWNSGMFVFRCSKYLDALRRFAPGILENSQRTMGAAARRDGIWLDADHFSSTPSDSIDYAVMEHTEDGVVVPLDAGWSDIGSWAALWKMAAKDDEGNVVVGDAVITGTTNSYIRAEGKLITVAGLDNVIVVSTPDAILVTTLDKCQDVKTIVDMLREQQRPEATRST